MYTIINMYSAVEGITTVFLGDDKVADVDEVRTTCSVNIMGNEALTASVFSDDGEVTSKFSVDENGDETTSKFLKNVCKVGVFSNTSFCS